jgi:hypothetical protein
MEQTGVSNHTEADQRFRTEVNIYQEGNVLKNYDVEMLKTNEIFTPVSFYPQGVFMFKEAYLTVYLIHILCIHTVQEEKNLV